MSAGGGGGGMSLDESFAVFGAPAECSASIAAAEDVAAVEAAGTEDEGGCMVGCDVDGAAACMVVVSAAAAAAVAVRVRLLVAVAGGAMLAAACSAVLEAALLVRAVPGAAAGMAGAAAPCAMPSMLFSLVRMLSMWVPAASAADKLKNSATDISLTWR